MLGRQQLVIDASEFLKGMSSGAEISDGGFSPETEAVNLINTPGAIYAPAAETNIDPDARLTGGIIASSPDMVVFLGTNRLLVAANGSYYSYNGTKIPAAALQTDAVNTYAKGFTDIITYAGRAYVTSKEKLIEWQTPSTFNNSFASFTNTAHHPHPALVFEDNAFYGDGNLLLRQTSAGSAPATILTLSTDQIIIALGIDPGTGKMLISTTSSLNISDTLPAINKVLWYDGFSAKVLKSVIVEDMITAFHSHLGIVFVGYGTNLGYLNGSGIEFLRTLPNTALDNTKLPYKHNFASIGNTLYVIDGTQVLAYGPVDGKRKVFYYAAKNKINSSIFDCIFNGGNNKLGLAFATTKLYSLDVTSVSTIDSLSLVTNWYHFPRPIHPRSVYIEFADSTSTNTTNFGTITYKNQDRTAGKGIQVDNSPLTFTSELWNIQGFLVEQIITLKLTIPNGTVNKGIKRIIIFYDWAE